MRRVDLAEQVLLTASGITRLLDGLERSGYVVRGACDSDRRVVYAVLTDEGLGEASRGLGERTWRRSRSTSRPATTSTSSSDLNALLGRAELGEQVDCGPPGSSYSKFCQ